MSAVPKGAADNGTLCIASNVSAPIVPRTQAASNSESAAMMFPTVVLPVISSPSMETGTGVGVGVGEGVGVGLGLEQEAVSRTIAARRSVAAVRGMLVMRLNMCQYSKGRVSSGASAEVLGPLRPSAGGPLRVSVLDGPLMGSPLRVWSRRPRRSHARAPGRHRPNHRHCTSGSGASSSSIGRCPPPLSPSPCECPSNWLT